jgi:L,D-transpeptidase ErfK/SrfK
VGEPAAAIRFGVTLACATALGGCVFAPAGAPGVAAPPASTSPDTALPRLPALETRYFDLATTQELLGTTQVLFVKQENTLPGIAREYNVGFEEIKNANPGVDVWLPGEGTRIYLPTAGLLPDVPREGIVINVASMRLLYYTTFSETTATGVTERLAVTSHPVGIGRQDWATPLGAAAVKDKARDPVWYPPVSVRAEHLAKGDPLPSVVPAGPDNPLGAFALTLTLPGYLIHGTNMPAGVGMRASHGCIRMYPEDIAELFDRVPRGTPVRIIDEPVLAGWHDEVLYLEVHPPLAEDNRDLAAEADRVIAAALVRKGKIGVVVDAAAVAQVVAEKRGLPFPVLASTPRPTQYLARARVVENTAPLSTAEDANAEAATVEAERVETTARAD